MRRSKERRPYHLVSYRNRPMDVVLALLTEPAEDYFVECRHGRQRRRK